MAILSNLNQVPVFNLSQSREDPRTIELVCDFTADTVYQGNFSQDRREGRFQTIRSVYFNLYNCANDVELTCNETGQSVRFTAGKQGYRNILISMGMSFRIVGTAPDIAKFNLLNIDMPEAEWPNLSGEPGTIPLSSLVNANAQYDVIGRKSAGSGPWEDCTRQELNIAGVDLANIFTLNQQINGASGPALTIGPNGNATLVLDGDGFAPLVQLTRYQTTGGGTNVTQRHAAGSIGAPAALSLNNVLGSNVYVGHDGTSFISCAQMFGRITQAVPGVGAMGARIEFQINPNSSSTMAAALSMDQTNGMMWGGNATVNSFLDPNRIFRNRVWTVGTLPAGVAGMETYVNDALAPTWNTALVGGGAVGVGARYNGAWVAF